MAKTGYPGGQTVDHNDSPVATLHCTSAEDPSCATGRSVSVPYPSFSFLECSC